MNPDTLEGIASRLRLMELEHVALKSDIGNIKDDVKDIKEDNRHSAAKVDERLGGINRLLWSVCGLLFTGFIAALGILVSQGGLH